MNALNEQFVTEARELIAQATDALIGIERDGLSAGHAESLLRAFHTLKGSAGLVGLPAMTLTMHAGEDLLAGIQDRRVEATPALISQALASLDLVARWMDAFEAEGELPPAAGGEARAMAELLQAHLAPAAGTAGSSAGSDLPQWASQLIAVHRGDISRHFGSRPSELHAIAYEPHAGCFFDGDDPLLLLRQLPGLLVLRVDSPSRDRLSDLDPFSCQVSFRAIVQGPRDQSSAIFRLVPDQVRIFDLPADTFGSLPQLGGEAETRSFVHRIVEEQSAMLRVAGPPESLKGRMASAARSASNALRHANLGSLAAPVSQAGATALANADAAPLLAALDQALRGLNATDPPPLAESPSGEATRTETGTETARRSLRIPEERIDALVNLSGELIVLKNAFTHLARRVEAEAGPDLSRAMKREEEAIGRLAGDFNDAIMRLRMVPMSQVLRPFPRLVRDLAQQLHKKLQFATRGETTEGDKAVVDRLFEPLLHIVRNAADHGVEKPDDRVDAGKPANGSIIIATSRAGDRIVVEVIDDGRGIDPAAVRRKALERGLLEPETLAALPDEQVLELIFAAGLSTAAGVSDISGRGVGMDVVRQTVEQIGGRVSVASRLGKGTTVRLDLPLTIATARIMVVEAAGQRFGIAMDAVTETVRLGPDRISEIKSNEGFVLRDRVIPICALAELLDLPGARSRSDARLLIVVETGAKIAAIEVDAIRDRMEAVLKPMQGLLASARGYAGTTILGDGSVLLVLDVKEILP